MKLFSAIKKLTNRLFGAKPREIVMAKADVVAAGIAALAQAESDAFGVAYDSSFAEGVASVPPSTGGGGFSQADIDAAVQAKVDADAVVLAQSQADDKAAFDAAKALSDAAIADLQSKFDALAQKEGIESGVITGLKGALQQIQDAEASLAGLFPAPVPTPDPTPVPDPVPPVDPAPAA